MRINEFAEKKITNSASAADICYTILKTEDQIDQDKEHLWSIGLNTAHKVKYVELVSLGTLNQTISTAREIFRLAISQGIHALIVCHNHPSGSLTPSVEDHRFTGKIRQAGEIIGIKLLDHVIIGNSGHYSFCDKGTL